jgi:hypothetical protein
MAERENLIRFIEELRANPDDHQDYENTYEDGWVDACNAILNQLHPIL